MVEIYTKQNKRKTVKVYELLSVYNVTSIRRFAHVHLVLPFLIHSTEYLEYLEVDSQQRLWFFLQMTSVLHIHPRQPFFERYCSIGIKGRLGLTSSCKPPSQHLCLRLPPPPLSRHDTSFFVQDFPHFAEYHDQITLLSVTSVRFLP